MKDWRCVQCNFPCTVSTNEPDAVRPPTCIYDKKKCRFDRVTRDQRRPALKWRHLYSDNNIKYGNLKRGSRIIANGVNEQDGKSICKAVNKEE